MEETQPDVSGVAKSSREEEHELSLFFLPILQTSASASHWLGLPERRKGEGMGKKSLILQCTSKNVSAQPVGRPQAKVVSYSPTSPKLGVC